MNLLIFYKLYRHIIYSEYMPTYMYKNIYRPKYINVNINIIEIYILSPMVIYV